MEKEVKHKSKNKILNAQIIITNILVYSFSFPHTMECVCIKFLINIL